MDAKQMQSHSFLLLSVCLLVSIMLTGCNTPSYNPDDPDEYVEYWCDPAHRQRAIPPDREWRRNIEYQSEELYRQACIEQYRLHAN